LYHSIIDYIKSAKHVFKQVPAITHLAIHEKNLQWIAESCGGNQFTYFNVCFNNNGWRTRIACTRILSLLLMILSVLPLIISVLLRILSLLFSLRKSRRPLSDVQGFYGSIGS